MEPLREIHNPWIEVTNEDDSTWKPSECDLYTGAEGGGKPGPSQKMIDTAKKSTALSNIFFAIVPLSFFSYVAVQTDKYCYKDWVVETIGKDQDGNVKTKPVYADCPAKTKGNLHLIVVIVLIMRIRNSRSMQVSSYAGLQF